MQTDVELLTSLSDEELESLANSTLAAASQNRLDELLARNADNELDDAGRAELESLLARVDQLTIVKTRASYTLRQHAEAAIEWVPMFRRSFADGPRAVTFGAVDFSLPPSRQSKWCVSTRGSRFNHVTGRFFINGPLAG
jgi:hypothetical protein